MFKARKRLCRTLAVVVAGVVAATGCGDSASSGGATEPQRGGTLTRISQGDPAGWDPATALLTPSTYAHLASPIYDLLVRVDAEGKVIPRLAESVTSDDNKTWLVKLRANVKFSDGTPLNAEAVKMNLDRYRKKEANQTAAMHGATATEVVDDVTVKVVLKDANPHFPRVLMGQSGMMAAPATLRAWAANENPIPIGAGPFVLTEQVPKTRFTYQRNPSYWDSPKPYLDKLVINVIADAGQGFNAFRAEEADIVTYTPGPPQEWKDLKDSDYQIVESTQIGGNAFLYQNQKAPTDDVRVRRALSLAADLDNANEQAGEGTETMAHTLFPENSPFYNDGLKQPVADLAKAQSLIDEYIGEKGGPVKIELPTSPASVKYAVVFAQQIQRLKGVQVVIDEGDTPHLLDRFYAGDFNMAFGTIKGNDPAEELQDRLACGSGRNNSKYCNPAVDEALRVGQQTTDVTKRKEAYRKVEEAIWTDVPFLLYSRLTVRSAAQEYVKGLAAYGGGDSDMAEVWLDK